MTDEKPIETVPPTKRKIPLLPRRTSHRLGVAVVIAVVLGGSILAPFFLWAFVPLFLAWVFVTTRNHWLGSEK